MNQKNTQTTNDDCLIITKRQSSLIIAGSMFVAFFIFTMGYFLGTKHATEEFVEQINQETFADQIFASVHSLSQNVSPLSIEKEMYDTKTQEGVALCTSSEKGLEYENTPSSNQYAAELIGFGTKKAAQQFIDRIAKKYNISLELRTRSHKNSQGKAVEWYQVVTAHYTDKHNLESIIATITQTEKLNGINIVSC